MRSCRSWYVVYPSPHFTSCSTYNIYRPQEDADAAAFWDLDQPLDVSPLHDVQNLVTHDEVAPAPNSAERPASALHDLFHQQENVPSALIRRESTHLVLDVSPPTVGPSRTSSQSPTWRA